MKTCIAIVLSFAAGCAGGGASCRVGADCESGVCFADGTCREDDGGGAETDAGMIDAGTVDPIDAGPMSEDAGPPGCEDDGITSAELTLPLDETVAIRVAFDTAIDSHGADRPDGTRLWDFEGPFSGDEDRSHQRRALDGEWFAATFPDADYTFPLEAGGDLRGVFVRTADAVLLAGIVSEQDGLTRAELTYDPPVSVWRFPLRVGASWEETTTVSGVASGIAAFYAETWNVAVDARGTVGTPAGTRNVLRVNTLIVRAGLSYRRLAFVACSGTVAQVFGADGDASEEPAYASELWRIAE